MVDTTWSLIDGMKGNHSVEDSDLQDQIVGMANRLADDVFSGRVNYTGEQEGDEEDFKTLLGCHLLELHEGGEVQSSSQTGGSVSMNVNTGEAANGLTETRWGRMAQVYLRDNASIAIETT